MRAVASLYHCSQFTWKLSVPACFICSSDTFILAGGVLSQPVVSAAEVLSDGVLMRNLPIRSCAYFSEKKCASLNAASGFFVLVVTTCEFSLAVTARRPEAGCLGVTNM